MIHSESLGQKPVLSSTPGYQEIVKPMAKIYSLCQASGKVPVPQGAKAVNKASWQCWAMPVVQEDMDRLGGGLSLRQEQPSELRLEAERESQWASERRCNSLVFIHTTKQPLCSRHEL